MTSSGITIRYYVEDGTRHTFTRNEIGDLLTKEGWKASYNNTGWTVEKGYENYTSLTATTTQVFAVSFASNYGIDKAEKYVAASGSIKVTLGDDVAATNWTGAGTNNIDVVSKKNLSYTVSAATPAADGKSIEVTLTAPASMKDDTVTLNYK